jgi:hypothetical protein
MPDALLGGRDDCHAVIIHHPGNKSSYDCCLVAILLPGKQLHFWMIFLELLLFMERQLLHLSFKLVTVYFCWSHALVGPFSFLFDTRNMFFNWIREEGQKNPFRE